MLNEPAPQVYTLVAQPDVSDVLSSSNPAEPGEYTGSAKRIPTITNLPLRKPNQLCNTRHVIWVIDCTEVDTLRIRAMLRQICRKWGR
eukprot:scaffold40219_cov372-Skeletonema_marinoi.AAC.1